MLSLGIVFPGQIHITKEVEVVGIFFKVFGYPQRAFIISVFCPYFYDGKLGIAKQQPVGVFFGFYLPGYLSFCYDFKVFIIVFPVKVADIFPCIFRYISGMIMCSQLLRK